MDEIAKRARQYFSGGRAAEEDWDRGTVNWFAIMGDTLFDQGYRWRRHELILKGRQEHSEEPLASGEEK